jgi:hypothetical protein
MPSEAGAGGALVPSDPPTFMVRAGCESVEYGRHTYALCRDGQVLFPQARLDCEAMGMNLIRVDDAEEQAFIYETFWSKPAEGQMDNEQTSVRAPVEVVGVAVIAVFIRAYDAVASWGRSLGPPNVGKVVEANPCTLSQSRVRLPHRAGARA